MTKVGSSKDVFITGKLPHCEEEWLRLEGVNEFYTDIDGKEIQCAAFTPPETLKATTGTVFIGGVPSDAQRRLRLPVVNKLFGYVAAGIAMNETDSSYGISFNWPGQGRSEGDILATTITSRTQLLLKLTECLEDRYKLERINLVGMSMGSYCVGLAVSQLNGLLKSVAFLSPAAYPEEAHDVPYDQGFQSIVRSNWNFSETPVKHIIKGLDAKGMISFFEYDDPPIPSGIQDMYRESADANPNLILHTIMGVAHNFRRPNVPPNSRNLIDNDAVRNFGKVLVDFLTTI